MKVIDIIAAFLLLIGGLNWGIIGIADFNVLNLIFGMWPTIERLIYILVGLAAIWHIFRCKDYCRWCSR